MSLPSTNSSSTSSSAPSGRSDSLDRSGPSTCSTGATCFSNSSHSDLPKGSGHSKSQKSACVLEKLSRSLELPLSEATMKGLLQIERLEGTEKTCHRLREVGFCEKATIELLSRGKQMICNVCGTRFALNEKLAQKIWVKPQIPPSQ